MLALSATMPGLTYTAMFELGLWYSEHKRMMGCFSALATSQRRHHHDAGELNVHTPAVYNREEVLL